MQTFPLTGTLTIHPPVTSSVVLYPTQAQQSSMQGDNWSNLENLTKDDGSVASCFMNMEASSEIVTLSGFVGGAVPEGAKITGYTIRIPRRRVGGTLTRDNRIRVGDGTVYGENLASMENWPTAQLEEAIYGGVNNLCGLDATPAQVNSPDFALELWVNDDDATGTAEVSRPSVEVHYTTIGFSLNVESQ